MRISYRRYPSLPPLAWLCDLTADREARLHMGRDVEVRDGFIVEGVWDGDFREGGFDATDRFFGTGVRFRQDRVALVPSLSTTDSLFLAEREGSRLASNSLPFLLAFLGDDLDPSYVGYALDQDSITLGIDDYQRRIPTMHGSVSRLMFHNCIVSRGGELTYSAKPMPPSFPDYESYDAYLDSGCSALLRNARDSGRIHPLAVFSTQSRGYDTTAVNAIASRYGIDAAFTVPQSKGRGRLADADAGSQDDDDGTEIAERLGVPCVRIDRRLFEQGFQHEEYFYACLYAPQDANLIGVFEDMRGPTVLLTGVLGEIWYPRASYAGRSGNYLTPSLRRWDLGGHGLSEVRLAVGFVQLPVPYVGARRRPDIMRITESAAMDPWRLGTAYDRPIPRRIAESRGIPRSAFGQRKLASVVEFALPQVPHSGELRAEFLRFLRDEDLLGRGRARFLPLVRRVNEFVVTHPAVSWYLRRALTLAGGSPSKSLQLWRRLNGAVHCFAVRRVATSYAAALRSPCEEWESST